MTEVVFYADQGESPALGWLDDQPIKVQGKFAGLIELLEEYGSTLSRPHAAPLRDKIYELRVRHQQVHYRLLYFFHVKGIAVIGHGCTKVDVVPNTEINRAVRCREKFIRNPDAHTYMESQ